MDERGLSQLPSPVKVFIISYVVLIVVGLLLSLWIVLKSPVVAGRQGYADQIQMPAEAAEAVKAAESAQLYLSLAHVHHLGHIFIVFSVAGIYAFTRDKKNTRTQIIVWTTIATLFHTLAFLIYSRLLLIVCGSVYGILLMYMLVMIVIDCYKPVREAMAEVE
jgi:hypothetical protein